MTFHFSGDRGPDWKLDPLVDIALGTLGEQALPAVFLHKLTMVDQESFEEEGVRPERHGWWEDGTSWVRISCTRGRARW